MFPVHSHWRLSEQLCDEFVVIVSLSISLEKVMEEKQYTKEKQVPKGTLGQADWNAKSRLDNTPATGTQHRDSEGDVSLEKVMKESPYTKQKPVEGSPRCGLLLGQPTGTRRTRSRSTAPATGELLLLVAPAREGVLLVARHQRALCGRTRT